MLRQLISIPRDQHFYIACSGGIDSMTIVDFYRKGSKRFSLAHFHHGTPQSDEFLEFVSGYATINSLALVVGKLSGEKPKDQSKEEFWRNERYKWLMSLNGTVATAHHLSDAIEGWIFSACHGTPKIILPRRDNIIRPFLLNTKTDILAWAAKYSVPFIEDKSNADTHFPRNNIRLNLMPLCLQINPGLHKTIRKKIIATSKKEPTQ